MYIFPNSLAFTYFNDTIQCIMTWLQKQVPLAYTRLGGQGLSLREKPSLLMSGGLAHP